MSRYSLSAAKLRAVLGRHPGYARIRVFVETGTYLGATTMLAHDLFPIVHTVEISQPLYERARARYGRTPGVMFHLGDSRTFVTELAASLAEPALWFLDAHWFKGTREPVGGRTEGLPLWDELRAIAARPAGDLILIDDVHAFDGKGPEPAWRGVNLTTIAAALAPHGEAVILGPHAVIYR